MKTYPAALTIVAILGSLPVGAGTARQDPPSQTGAEEARPLQSPTPLPAEPPPPPPAQVPEPPSRRAEAPPRDLPSGQWVYTDQYDWVWMPYGDRYAHVPPDGGPPNMYVYYPSEGWCWVVAPWLWGWGPRPFFGVLGPVGFGWWGHGYGHWYGFEGRYAYGDWGGWGYHQGGRWYTSGPRGGWGSASPRGFSGRGSTSPRGFSGRGLSPAWRR